MKFNMNIKPLLVTAFSMCFILIFTACSDDETTIVDSSMPVGMFSATSSGMFVAQNGTGSAGTAELGMDSEGTQFLHFGSNFMTELGTGTVNVYLSTSSMFTPDPMNGNPDLLLVGPVKSNGENYFKLDAAPDSKFTHVILWCGSANIPFGNAELK